MGRRVAIALLRNDLRIHDNAIFHEVHSGAKADDIDAFLPLFVFDERQIELSGVPGFRPTCEAKTRLCGFWRTGPHRTRFLVETVTEFRKDLKARGSDLIVRFGRPGPVTVALIEALEKQGDTIQGVYIQKEVTSEETASEKKIEQALASRKLSVTYFGTKPLVHHDDLPFKIEKTPDIFTPFRKAVEGLNVNMWRRCLPAPDKFKPPPSIPEGFAHAIPDAELELEPLLKSLLSPLAHGPDNMNVEEVLRYGRSDKAAIPYIGGETHVLERVKYYFLEGSPPPAARYKSTRNGLLGPDYSTKLSPALAVGCVSPRKIMEALEDHEQKYGASKDSYWVAFELLWRDYFYYIAAKYGNHLFYYEGLEGKVNPRDAKAKVGEWADWNQNGPQDPKLQAWLDGKTGIPLIDANILEMKQTGYMSNRGRQNVASFLTKDILFDWRIGAELFESFLIDHDVCSNTGNWQYQAGVGTDPRAARQFNPIKQGHDYDPRGEYVAHWLPCLSGLAPEYRQCPWAAPADQRRQAGLEASPGQADPYPVRPILEQNSWKPHYGRKARENGFPPRARGHGRGRGRGRGGRSRPNKAEGGPNGQMNGIESTS